MFRIIQLAVLSFIISLTLACAQGDITGEGPAENNARPEPNPDTSSNGSNTAGEDAEVDGGNADQDPECTPSDEICNGEDDDCDGEIDEDFPSLGSDCSDGTGACQAEGAFVCGEDGAVVCSANPTPSSAELCGNGIDDDCDGEIDEGFEMEGQPCTVGRGACAGDGVYRCSDDQMTLTCDASETAPDDELCGNGIDDDCDGEIDEGFDDVGDTCSAGLGVCETPGTIVCSTDLLGSECDAVPGPAGTELCGNSLDDDCDGEIDEGFDMVGMACSEGLGACQSAGIYECTADALNFTCSATPGPSSTEVCGNGIDDDCDGQIDEGFDDVGTSCNVSFQRCSATGTVVCDGTATTCDATITPSTETCDGTDEDCDGDIDEDAVCGTCQDDSFEINDFPEDAASLPASVRHALTSCFTDPDWFALDGISAGQTIVINATFVDLAADLDLRLLDPGGATVAAGTSTTDDEQIRHVASATGTYLLEVRQVGPKADQDYTLYWSSGPAPSCTDDAWESNDTPATAAPLPLDRTVQGEICAGTVDYYDLGFLTRGFGIEITLDHVASNGDLDLRLYRYGSEVAAATTTTDDETIVFWPDFGGEFVLLVEGDTSFDANSYTLSTTFAGSFVCEASGDDVRSEPDDTPDAATSLTANNGITAAICGTDDWIRLPNIAANDTIVASLFFEHDIGDLDLFIYPDLGAAGPYDFSTQVAVSRSTTDDEHVRVTIGSAGDYLAQVQGFGGDRGRYRFAWDVVAYSCDDPFEPNNRFSSFPSLAYETSTRLEPLTTYTGTLCSGDLDNFELGVYGVGQTITATVVGNSGAFEIELYDGLTSVASDSTTGMTKVVTWTTTDDDDHTLAVRPLTGSDVDYDVSYEVN